MSAETNKIRGKVVVLDEDSERAGIICKRLQYLNYEPVRPSQDIEVIDCCADSVAIMVGSVANDPKATAQLSSATDKFAELPILKMRCSDGRETEALRVQGAEIWAVDAPLRRSQLEHLLESAERHKHADRRCRITGMSESIREVRREIDLVAGFDTTVLITGESGTGKELVANTVHDLSARGGKPFVPVNCGAIPPELLESELFGHEKGSFTGAVAARKGRFELAEGGTLFLDEIGDMGLEMQAKLLRVLQERCIERVGSNESRPCNVRIVAATHRNLEEAVREGKFREDLYYRINVFPLRMPPLRKRSSDIPELLEELLVQQAGDEAGKLRLSRAAIAALARYPWPGNVRELSNLVERLAILHPEGEISLEMLPGKYREFASDEAPSVASDIELGDMNLKDHLARIECTLIEDALAKSDGVVAKAARLLSLRRTTLVEKLSKYGIDTQAVEAGRAGTA